MNISMTPNEIQGFLARCRADDRLGGKTPDELLAMVDRLYGKLAAGFRERTGEEITPQQARDYCREYRWDLFPETIPRDINAWLGYPEGSDEAEVVWGIYRERGKDGLLAWLNESDDVEGE